MTGESDRTASFRAELTAIIPSLRAFSYALVGRDRDMADDMAQTALTKAWAARDSYAPGTNFKAWIFRILRNHYYTTSHRERRFVAMDPRSANGFLVQPPTQGADRGVRDIERGLASLPAPQREVLMLLASGLQWEEIAAIVGSPIGTIKSRITRGRAALRAYLDGPPAAADAIRPAGPQRQARSRIPAHAAQSAEPGAIETGRGKLQTKTS